MRKTLHFTYQSPENLVRLLCDIHYEKTHSSREIAVYHERFEDEPDSLFYQFMIALYPNGTTIGATQIEEICNHIQHFLDNDEKVKDIKVRYDMLDYDSYVYFDIDKKVYPCDHTSHQQCVKNICVEYFKGFDPNDLSDDMVRDFIVKHFVVKSRFSTAETIANDADYICRCILFENDEI